MRFARMGWSGGGLRFGPFFVLLLGCAATVAPEGPPPLPPSRRAPSVVVVSATYGLSCGAPLGNMTDEYAKRCRDWTRCSFRVTNQYGDPAPGCGKDFWVEYRCGDDPSVRRAGYPARRGEGYKVTLTCEPRVNAIASSQPSDPFLTHVPPVEPPLEPGEPGSEITVVAATYGGNCGAPPGNATAHVADECRGKSACRYRVNNRYGDPALRCGKDFLVEYRCGDDPTLRRAGHQPLLGEGYFVTLSCPSQTAEPLPSQEPGDLPEDKPEDDW